MTKPPEFFKRPSFHSKTRRAHKEQSAHLHMPTADNCHRIPYKTIESNVLKYMKGQITYPEFLDFVHLVYGPNTDKEKKIVISLISKFELKKDKRIGKKVLSALNSAIPNLRPGEASMNRSIGGRLDTRVIDHSFTPQSKKLLSKLPVGCSLPITYLGELKTSFFQIGNITPKGAKITPDMLTPDSGKLLKEAMESHESEEICKKLF